MFGSRGGWERPNWFAPDGVEPVDQPSFGQPNWFTHVGAAHHAVRNGVGLIDQTSFAKFEITGPGALDAVQWLSVANMDKSVGTVTYTQLCNERGGIECDLTMIRTAADSWYVVTGAAFGAHDMGWIRSPTRRHDGSVIVRDLTSARAVINLCGPLSRTVLQSVCEDDVSNEAFRYARAREITIGSAPVLAIRIGYVGELGWELHIPTEYAAHVYELLRAAGEPHGIVDVGYRTIDTMRMEKGYLYWSTDITPDTTPWEAGLGWRVDLGKGDFCGRDALVAQRDTGISRTAVHVHPRSRWPTRSAARRSSCPAPTTSSGSPPAPTSATPSASPSPTATCRSNSPIAPTSPSRSTANPSPPPATTGPSYDPDNTRLKS